MSHRPAHDRRSGFTLLEVVVASAMIAILGISLATAMGIAFRARDTAREQTSAIRDAAILADVLQQELSSLLPPTDSSPLAGPFTGYATGTPMAPADVLEFWAIGRDHGTPGDAPFAEGARWVQLALSTDGGTGLLVRRVRRNLLATVLEDPAEEVLLSGVRSFAVRYYDGYDWVEEWDSTQYGNSLPLAVQITIELDTPSLHDPEQPYRLVQTIPVSAARPDLIEQALSGEVQ